MSTSVSVTTTYAGEFAGKYVAPALLTANTIAQGGVTVKSNVKYKEVLKRLSLSGILKDDSCDFDASGTVALTERILEPKRLKVNIELCKNDYRSDWEALSMGASAHDNLPKNFSDFMIAQAIGVVAQKNEISIWRGVASNTGEFDGFETKLALDPALVPAQEVTGTTITASNVIAELGKVVDAMPDALFGRDDVRLYVSQKIAKAYVRALGGYSVLATSNAGVDNKGTQWYNGGGLTFEGIQMIVCNGMSPNVAILTTIDNLYFGTGLMSDETEVKVLDMGELDGSDNVRVIMKMSAGVQYANIEDIVTYGIANALVS